MSDCAAALSENVFAGSLEPGSEISPAPWYVLQVRPRYESLVAELLDQKEVEHYLPLYTTRKRWSDRFVESKQPVFPGYIFCRLDYNSRVLPVLTTPGVLRVLGVGRTPVPVDEQELEAVRLVVESGRAASTGPMPKVGDQVRIQYGPLAGVEGIMVGQKKERRLVVSITLLQRSVSVEIEDDWAQLVNSKPASKAGDLAYASSR